MTSVLRVLGVWNLLWKIETNFPLFDLVLMGPTTSTSWYWPAQILLESPGCSMSRHLLAAAQRDYVWRFFCFFLTLRLCSYVACDRSSVRKVTLAPMFFLDITKIRHAFLAIWLVEKKCASACGRYAHPCACPTSMAHILCSRGRRGLIFFFALKMRFKCDCLFRC